MSTKPENPQNHAIKHAVGNGPKFLFSLAMTNFGFVKFTCLNGKKLFEFKLLQICCHLLKTIQNEVWQLLKCHWETSTKNRTKNSRCV